MNSAILEPRDMQWIEKGVLGIEWSDGHQGIYPVRSLRQQCPCAACTDEWTGQLRLQPDDVPMLIMLEDIESVGRYALQFTWSDGHSTGIYSYAFLRRICQCDICQPVKLPQPKSRRLL
ncbi:MAG: gamma-butyrobetaine hydroxylase-like domain-containing protein [Nitrospiraceae bacterium]